MTTSNASAISRRLWYPNARFRRDLWSERCAGRNYEQRLSGAARVMPVLCPSCAQLMVTERPERCPNMVMVRLEDVAVKDREL
jgi:hypothetical protein